MRGTRAEKGSAQCVCGEMPARCGQPAQEASTGIVITPVENDGAEERNCHEYQKLPPANDALDPDHEEDHEVEPWHIEVGHQGWPRAANGQSIFGQFLFFGHQSVPAEQAGDGLIVYHN